MKTSMQQWKNAVRAMAFMALVTLALAGCSGGGGDGSPTPTLGQSSWDAMVWDQHNWQ